MLLDCVFYPILLINLSLFFFWGGGGGGGRIFSIGLTSPVYAALLSFCWICFKHTHTQAKEILTKDHRQIDKTEIIRKVQKTKQRQYKK